MDSGLLGHPTFQKMRSGRHTQFLVAPFRKNVDLS